MKAGKGKVHLAGFNPPDPDHLFMEFVAAASEFLEEDSGAAEQIRYTVVVDKLEELEPTTLLRYGEMLNVYVAMAERGGVYGNDGISAVRSDYFSRLGPHFMHLQYDPNVLQLEGCDGLC